MLNLTYIDAGFLGLMLLMTGIAIGILASEYFVRNHMENTLLFNKIFGFFFAFTYVFLQVYVVLTNGQPLDWFFSAAGFVMVGYVTGINLGQYIPTRK